MHYFNDWHDYLRTVIFVVSLWCCWALLVRFRRYSGEYTGKTLDYWYALFMWCVVGVVSSVQGVVTDRPLTPAYIATCAAVLVTAKGVHKKEEWGGSD